MSRDYTEKLPEDHLEYLTKPCTEIYLKRVKKSCIISSQNSDILITKSLAKLLLKDYKNE